MEVMQQVFLEGEVLGVSSFPNPSTPVALVLCGTGGGGRGCSKARHGENDNKPA